MFQDLQQHPVAIIIHVPHGIQEVALATESVHQIRILNVERHMLIATAIMSTQFQYQWDKAVEIQITKIVCRTKLFIDGRELPKLSVASGIRLQTEFGFHVSCYRRCHLLLQYVNGYDPELRYDCRIVFGSLQCHKKNYCLI